MTTKILKTKIYVFSRNLHLKNLLQELIININVELSINVIDMTVEYIRKYFMSKKNRKSKLRIISL